MAPNIMAVNSNVLAAITTERFENLSAHQPACAAKMIKGKVKITVA